MFQKPPCFFNACVQSKHIAVIFRLVHTGTAFRSQGANELMAPLTSVFTQPGCEAVRYEVTWCRQHQSSALAHSPPSWSPYMTDDSWGDNNPTAGSVMRSSLAHDADGPRARGGGWSMSVVKHVRETCWHDCNGSVSSLPWVLAGYCLLHLQWKMGEACY